MTDFNNELMAKAKQKKLDWLNSLPYPVLLEQKNKKFCLLIPELSLITVNDDLETAYRELCAKKEKLFNDLLEYGSEDTINPPRKTYEKHQIFTQLKIFVYKCLIVCLLAVVLFVVGYAEIKSSLSAAFNSGTIKKRVVQEIEDLVNVPEKVKQERAERLHNILNGLSPFINEFRSSFKDSPE